METDEIVPNILPKVPSKKINVTYSNKTQVDLGNDLTPEDVKAEPTVKWDCDQDKFYTLIMLDPDAPSKTHPFLGQVNHWMIVNIQGCDVTSGEVIADYSGPGAPRYTGVHRYIFVVFEQKEKLSFNEKISRGMTLHRINFSVKQFMVKYGFEEVFAWNYFKSQWCPSVKPDQKTRTCVCL